MLVQSNHVIGKPVIGVQEGRMVATIDLAIINPDNLKLAGFYCSGPWSQKKQMIVQIQDIKSIQNDKVLIDSSNDITPLEDLVRIQPLAKLKFNLNGKSVRTESKKNLGKVSDYAINLSTFEIQKIYVNQSIFKNLGMHNLLIDREQILELTDHEIIVSDASIKRPAPVPQQAT
jgi:uncharacterized protein YrrD